MTPAHDPTPLKRGVNESNGRGAVGGNRWLWRQWFSGLLEGGHETVSPELKEEREYYAE